MWHHCCPNWLTYYSQSLQNFIVEGISFCETAREAVCSYCHFLLWTSVSAIASYQRYRWMRVSDQAKANRKRREMQRHIYYTEPTTPVAGRPCDVFYNPDITNLRGRLEIWIQGSFNRWSHAQRFGPLQMHPVLRGGSGFLKAQIQVFIPPPPSSQRTPTHSEGSDTMSPRPLFLS